MASHSLAIAKAALAAALMRPDPIPVPRTEIINFHDLLQNLLSKCSPINIQLCKEWLLKNIIPSSSRVAAFGKYLVAYSGSTESLEDEKGPTSDTGKTSSTRRKRLYILYLLNDLLHHTKYHIDSSSAHLILTKGLRSYISDIFRLASNFSPGTFTKHRKKIDILLSTWAENGYYPSSYFLEIRETLQNGNIVDSGEKRGEVKDLDEATRAHSSGTKDDTPYIMPATHGDMSTPYYDLPVGNMMICITPNSTVPINPQSVKPLHFQAGYVKESLAKAVKNFLSDVDSSIKIENDMGIFIDIDELGQINYHDRTTGSLTEGESYYGWSREFCRKLQKRYGGKDIPKIVAEEDETARNNLSPRKRRRYSYSESRSRSRSISRSNSPVGRSPLRHKDRRSYSRERSRSRHLTYSRSRSRSATRSNSYSPQPPAQPQPSRAQVFPPSAFPTAINHSFPLGSDGLPIPPPPPPGYKGPWPPPPPPLPPVLPASRPNLSLSGTTYHTISNSVPPYPPVFPNSGLPPTYIHGSQGNQRQTPTNYTSWGQQ